MWRFLVILGSLSVCLARVSEWDVFSTKTAYTWSVNPRDPQDNDGNHRVVNETLCKAAHVFMVVRHGSRYPSSSSTRRIAALLQKLLTSTSGAVNDNLRQWSNPYTADLANELAPEGEVELKGLGRRTGKRFQGLFTENGKHLMHVSSRKSRAKDSAENFHYGLVNAVRNIGNYSVQINDSLARFYEDCGRYDKQVDENATHFAEFTKFEKTPEFINVRKSLGSKLGINFALNPAEVYLIYELCSYDKYLQGQESFWCDLLTDQDRRILEYGQDIEEFYETGYGYELNGPMACPLVGDMFRTMGKAVNDTWNYQNLPQDAIDNGYLSGKFVFGHSETVLRVMTALGLYRDASPLLASNRLAMENRKWRTSKISPYMTNVALALYACDQLSNSVTSADRAFMVQLFVNEQIVRIPGCPDDMCPYEHVRQLYDGLINGCNITEICTVPDHGDPSAASVTLSSLVIYLVPLFIRFLLY